ACWPRSDRPYGDSLALGAAVCLRLPLHMPSRDHAVAFGSQLPPTGSVRDLHPQSIIHVQRTRTPLWSVRQNKRRACHYQISFSASWICLDVVVVVSIKPADVILVPVASKIVLLLTGEPKLGWLNRLNNSARNCRLNFSVILLFLNAEKSTFQ